MKQDWSGCRDLAAPFHFFASVKMIIIAIIIIIQQILNKSNPHPDPGEEHRAVLLPQ
jgi:hypothetical protein